MGRPGTGWTGCLREGLGANPDRRCREDWKKKKYKRGGLVCIRQGISSGFTFCIQLVGGSKKRKLPLNRDILAQMAYFPLLLLLLLLLLHHHLPRPHPIRFRTHFGRIPAALLQVGAEVQVLVGDGVLADMGQQEPGQEGAEDAQARAHEERILAAADAGRAARGVVLDNGKHIGPHEGADFAHGGCDGVVLPADGGGAGLGRYEPDVVARTGFAEREKDSSFVGRFVSFGGARKKERERD